MKTSQAISTVLRRHTGFPGIGDVPLEQLQDLLAALNAAVQEMYDLMPANYKRTTATQAIGGASTATGLGFEPLASVSTNSTAFNSDERCQAVVIAGDPQVNEIVAQDAILFPYAGLATGETGTIYVDTMTFFDFSIERLIAHPRCRRHSTGHTWELSRDDEGWTSNWAHMGGPVDLGLAGGIYIAPQRKRRIGPHPITYRQRFVGNSRNTDADAVFGISVDPIPTERFTLEAEVLQKPLAWKVEQMLDGAEMPMPDGSAYLHLVPILADHLRETSLWTTPDRERVVAERADRARYSLTQLSRDHAPPVYGIGSRPGY